MPEELGVESLHYNAEEMAAYFSGEMPDDEAERMESHLGRCDECRNKAEHLSERSAVWFAWTPEAHRAAVAAAHPEASERHWVAPFLELFRAPAVRALSLLAVALLVALVIWRLTGVNPGPPPERATQSPPAPATVPKLEPPTPREVVPP